MKILIIDNNIDQDCWGAKELCRLAITALGATVFVRRAPQDDLPKDPRSFDRIIVSGSKTSALEEAPWIDNLTTFIHKAMDAQIPYLGVCYGHQALVKAVAGKDALRKAVHPEIGWVEIQIKETCPLFDGLPRKFYSFASHYDEVGTLPNGMKNLACSEFCSIQACQLESLPIYGIQFHPEKNLKEGTEILTKKKDEPHLLLNAIKGHKLYNPQVGEILFRNFLK